MNRLAQIRESIASIPRFLSEVKAEMKKVSFPSRDEVIGTTVVVLLTTFIFGFYLWLADLVIVQFFKLLGGS